MAQSLIEFAMDNASSQGYGSADTLGFLKRADDTAIESGNLLLKFIETMFFAETYVPFDYRYLW